MICIDCVTPEPLKKIISKHGTISTCQYCRNDGIAVSPKLLFDYILERAEENTANEDNLSSYEYGMLFDCGVDDIPIGFLDDVLADWMNLGDESYFDDLYKYAPTELKLNNRGMDRHYFGDDGLLEMNFYEEMWKEFIGGISHSHRFFNPSAKGFLDSVFASLFGDGNELKPKCVRTIQRGEPLYRARTASTYADAETIASDPVRQLGPPPKDRACSQRMTPYGISALYCSLERETCLSEIRPITGDKAVSIAMTPINQLKLLDLTKLGLVDPPDLSLLDKGFRDALHLKTFINSLVKKMSKPKGRNDELSYLSTQVVFEYLRLSFDSQIDGLVFPSVQTGEQGINVVLFPEASVVSSKNFKDMTDHEATGTAESDFEPEEKNQFEEEAKLYCVSGSIRFHKIKAVETKADEYEEIAELSMSDLDRNCCKWL